MVGEAYAADNAVKLGFGGRYLGTAGGLVWDDASDDVDPDSGSSPEDSRDVVFKQDIEVHFTGEGVLDNGLTVGARIELEGQTQADDQIDETWAELSGGFGALRFGDTPEALGQMCFLVPSASSMFGADSPIFNFSNAGVFGYGATNGTCYGIDDKSTKALYFSPNFAGFQFAVSYSPDNTEDTRNVVDGFATRPDNDPGQLSENLSIAAQYATDFNGFNIAIGGAWSHPFDVEVADGVDGEDDDVQEWNAYAQVGAWGFTLGGAFRQRANIDVGDDEEDNTVYGVGLVYGIDAYQVGIGWTHGDYDSLGSEDHDDIVATASYALGPGVAIDGMVEYSNYDGDGDGGTVDDDFEGVGLGLGLVVRF
jgi:hypothetical protein